MTTEERRALLDRAITTYGAPAQWIENQFSAGGDSHE